MIKDNSGSFLKGINSIPGEVSAEIERNIRRAAINIGSSIIMGTPHDTGLARGNWQTSVNEPIKTETTREDPNGSAATGQLKSVAGSFQIGLDNAIYITNNLPYINRLNSGWSVQASPGYIERAVEATQLQIKG